MPTTTLTRSNDMITTMGVDTDTDIEVYRRLLKNGNPKMRGMVEIAKDSTKKKGR